jgi:hypothetical protein
MACGTDSSGSACPPHLRAGVAPTLEPAAARVRTNLNALRQLMHGRQTGKILPAEDAVDAAEAYAARTPDPGRRAALLSAAGCCAASTRRSSGWRPTSAAPARPYSHGPLLTLHDRCDPLRHSSDSSGTAAHAGEPL